MCLTYYAVVLGRQVLTGHGDHVLGAYVIVFLL